ncbi:MAG: efflux RND transporter periplasmic adaptor subunit [Clostridium sp.]|nr:efflux RND transporter periplasmic adaptor subunit [Clostridium sp.]
MKKRIGFLLALVATIGVSCSDGKKAKEEAVTLAVKVDTVMTCGQDFVWQYPGRVKAAQDVRLAFRVSGTLSRVAVKEGEYVRKGQLLAEMDDTDYKVQLSATEAEYQSIKSEADRVEALYKENGATAVAYDKARYGLKQITAKRENHRNQLSYTKIYAPFNGYIQQRLFDGGETVAAGMPVLSLLCTDRPEVEISIPAAAYIRREQFSSFDCVFDVYPGQTFPLELINIMPRANANQLYTVRFRLAGTADTKPTPGMATWVTIRGGGSADSRMWVPATAVVAENGKSHIYLCDSGSGVVRKTPVTVERVQTDGRAVVTGALRAGALVVTSGMHHLADGDRVTIMQSKSETNVGGLL